MVELYKILEYYPLNLGSYYEVFYGVFLDQIRPFLNLQQSLLWRRIRLINLEQDLHVQLEQNPHSI